MRRFLPARCCAAPTGHADCARLCWATGRAGEGAFLPWLAQAVQLTSSLENLEASAQAGPHPGASLLLLLWSVPCVRLLLLLRLRPFSREAKRQSAPLSLAPSSCVQLEHSLARLGLGASAGAESLGGGGGGLALEAGR